ncbi:MAG: glycoside hydrolase family 127 protein, partial [Planctomycetes bacterium]|nr:glycoside hydrolase family 127 protein [Planctomycetota bacterium]
NKHDHEASLAGYFIEAGIAHYQMTGRTDARMYEAAKRLADCWYENIGPEPKRSWYGGHQEMEQALVRLARCVDDVEGPGKGRRYVELAKFLMDNRRDGDAYDQTHLPVVQQYEAVGHAVRAVYSYSGMADIAMETGDVGYHSAILSLCDNIVNKKYYVTGGVGSGETAEGFGKNYSLPNNSYCESCAGCGELFFQHKMHLIHHDARYADLYEETIYNAILGGIDLDGKNFFYVNALDAAGTRHPWHVCPCCVGNIPRTLLQMPTWMYTTSADSLYINLFVGSTVSVGRVAGADVQVVQATDYPWSGNVSITLNPSAEARFTVRIRVPNRSVSDLYTCTPNSDGIERISVNGSDIDPAVENGYAVITRNWKAGDRIELVLPMHVQRIKASDKIAADAGRVAVRVGPLIYNIESVDQDLEQILPPTAVLSREWKPDLLRGVTIVKGTFADGSAMTAIPNYARLNRGGRSIVWIKDRP